LISALVVVRYSLERSALQVPPHLLTVFAETKIVFSEHISDAIGAPAAAMQPLAEPDWPELGAGPAARAGDPRKWPRLAWRMQCDRVGTCSSALNGVMVNEKAAHGVFGWEWNKIAKEVFVVGRIGSKENR
jgi:hypothetical protein